MSEAVIQQTFLTCTFSRLSRALAAYFACQGLSSGNNKPEVAVPARTESKMALWNGKQSKKS